MARRGKKQGEDGPGGDLRILTVALNLILLVFFVYINTLGVENENKKKIALDSIVGAFSVLPSGVQLTPGKKLSIEGGPITTKDKIQIKKTIEHILKDQIFGKKVEMVQRGKDLVIHVADDVLYSSGRADLHPIAKELLKKVAPALKNSLAPIRVEGHTDDRPISTERFPSNWELSTARAMAVLRYLSDEFHIPHGRLTAVGFGEHQPLYPNDTPEHRAKNRRVNIVLVGGA